MSERFENKLKQTLERGAARVDQATREELARRRRAAMESADRGRGRNWYWLPAGVAAAAVVAALLVQLPANQDLPQPVADQDEMDLEILLAEESLDLYEELEFYAWLDLPGDAG